MRTMIEDFLLLVLFVFGITFTMTALASCATLRTVCGTGIGIGYGDPSMFLDAVVIDSPADRAGVLPGGYIQSSSKNFPPKGQGDVTLVVRYPTSVKTFVIEQGDYCGEVRYQGQQETGNW